MATKLIFKRRPRLRIELRFRTWPTPRIGKKVSLSGFEDSRFNGRFKVTAVDGPYVTAVKTVLPL